jgi:hypothetical protein
MNKDDPDRRVQFCKWFQHKVQENEEFLSKITLPDEATFKLNGTVTRQNYVYWAPENPHLYMEKTASLPGLTAWV